MEEKEILAVIDTLSEVIDTLSEKIGVGASEIIAIYQPLVVTQAICWVCFACFVLVCNIAVILFYRKNIYFERWILKLMITSILIAGIIITENVPSIYAPKAATISSIIMHIK